MDDEQELPFGALGKLHIYIYISITTGNPHHILIISSVRRYPEMYGNESFTHSIPVDHPFVPTKHSALPSTFNVFLEDIWSYLEDLRLSDLSENIYKNLWKLWKTGCTWIFFSCKMLQKRIKEPYVNRSDMGSLNLTYDIWFKKGSASTPKFYVIANQTSTKRGAISINIPCFDCNE